MAESISATPLPSPAPVARSRSFRSAVLRGLALILPPILTIVIFLWIYSTIETYVLQPVTGWTRAALVWSIWDVREGPDAQPAKPSIDVNGQSFTRLRSGEYVPQYVIDALRPKLPPDNAAAAFREYVDQQYLRRVIVLPIFLILFFGVLYVLGKLFAAGVGNFFDGILRRLPLIKSVYNSVKKVTDLVFVDDHVEFSRVVAIEYPRPGCWTIGFVTSEGMLEIAGAAGEPCVNVAVPGSPAPFTGNVVTVPKRAAHDLNLSIDEALQFFISCGVVVPARELRGRTVIRRADPGRSD